MNEAIEGQRTLLLEQLRALQQEYLVRAKPIIDQLVEIENLRPPRPFVMPADLDGNFYIPQGSAKR